MLVIALYTSLLYAIIYDFFVIIPFAFASNRGFKPESIGLIYITLFIGFSIAACNYLFIQESINRHIRAKTGKSTLSPETSLIHAIYGCAFAPVGLFLFAWTVPFTSRFPKNNVVTATVYCDSDTSHVCPLFCLLSRIFDLPTLLHTMHRHDVGVHWIVPAIGIVLLCAGSMSAFTSLIPYLVAYGGPSAPSVLAAAGFCRSALAAALVSY